MVAIRGRFDGKVIIPDEPLDLLPDQRLILHIEPVSAEQDEQAGFTLDWIAENAVDDPSLPTDLAHQHDHYFYGVPKKTP